jgi:hypothetical protein
MMWLERWPPFSMFILIGLGLSMIGCTPQDSNNVTESECVSNEHVRATDMNPGINESVTAPTAPAEPPISAIAEAKIKEVGGELFNILRREAKQFGIAISDHTDVLDAYRNIRHRLFANPTLVCTFKKAQKEGVTLFLSGLRYSKSVVREGHLIIDTNASDEDLIRFVSENWAVAKEKAIVLLALKKEAAQFGVALSSDSVGAYKQIRERLFTNEDLVSAIKTARKHSVYVSVGRFFIISERVVHINVDATDQEIIDFLLGMKQQPE